MTISPTAPFLAEIVSGGDTPLAGAPIPAGQKAYFQERLKARVYELIIDSFLSQCEGDSLLTQAAVARRLGKRPEQINRWMSGPSNLTLETVSDLVLAICGKEPSLSALPFRHDKTNQTLSERQGSGMPNSADEPKSNGSLREFIVSSPADHGLISQKIWQDMPQQPNPGKNSHFNSDLRALTQAANSNQAVASFVAVS